MDPEAVRRWIEGWSVGWATHDVERIRELYGDGPVMTMKQRQRVRWYLLDIGDVANFHTPHWLGGNLVTYHHTRTDVFSILPASMETADMVADVPGLFLFHCQVDDHHQAGMVARYEVQP